MHYVYNVLALLFVFLSFRKSNYIMDAYQQRKVLHDINPAVEIPGFPPLSVYRNQLVFWHVLLAISLVLFFVLIFKEMVP